MRSGYIILIVVSVMLIAGTIFAIAWWHMADIIFPGTAKKTGQRILGGEERPADTHPGATVIRDFDKPAGPPSPANTSPSDPPPDR